MTQEHLLTHPTTASAPHSPLPPGLPLSSQRGLAPALHSTAQQSNALYNVFGEDEREQQAPGVVWFCLWATRLPQQHNAVSRCHACNLRNCHRAQATTLCTQLLCVGNRVCGLLVWCCQHQTRTCAKQMPRRTIVANCLCVSCAARPQQVHVVCEAGDLVGGPVADVVACADPPVCAQHHPALERARHDGRARVRLC